MFGDLMIRIKRFIKQNMTCGHEYKYTTRTVGTQTFRTRECEKCGRMKTKRI